MIDLFPEGCFVAEDDGRVIGLLTMTRYGRLAFLGAVIVDPKDRGRGLGKLLMDSALRRAAELGIRTVRLNAYLNVVAFYERLGFTGEYEVVRWHAAASRPGPANATPATGRDLDALAAFDATPFGASRRDLLARLLQEYPTSFLVAREGSRIVGYLVGSPYARACEIGPWVVAPGRGDVARGLFHALVEVVGPREYAFSGPSVNEALEEFVREAGFSEVFRTRRMWWGEDLDPGMPSAIWAAGGLEKG